jgi:rhodanese-related sulfurtransferase
MHIEILNNETNYAGDISPITAWHVLKELKKSTLLDVRTQAELNFVGQPDLSSINKSIKNVELQMFPSGNLNSEFAKQAEIELESEYIKKEDPLLFLCRSGARSAKSASLMALRGWKNCYNIAYGFEGDPNENHHRSCINGWKKEGLPWIQL